MFTDFSVPGGERFQIAKFTMKPKEGSYDDFNADIAMSIEEYGAYTSNNKIEGTVTVDETEVEFTVPVERAASLNKLAKRQAPGSIRTFPHEQLYWEQTESSFSLDKAGFTSKNPLEDTVIDELMAGIEQAVADFKE